VQAVREGRVPGMAVAEQPPTAAHAGASAGAGVRPSLPASGAHFVTVHLGLRKPHRFEARNTCTRL